MITPKIQHQQSINLRDYNVRIIVAGTRGYNDRVTFHEVLIDYMNRFNDSILFLSGAASSGADRLIIEWCAKFNYPCKQYPANWGMGKGAGYARNEQMGKVATNLLAFHNGESPGTAHMISFAKYLCIPTRVITI